MKPRECRPVTGDLDAWEPTLPMTNVFFVQNFLFNFYYNRRELVNYTAEQKSRSTFFFVYSTENNSYRIYKHQKKTDFFISFHLAYLKSQFSRKKFEERLIVALQKTNVSHTQLIISPWISFFYNVTINLSLNFLEN